MNASPWVGMGLFVCLLLGVMLAVTTCDPVYSDESLRLVRCWAPDGSLVLEEHVPAHSLINVDGTYVRWYGPGHLSRVTNLQCLSEGTGVRAAP